MCHITNFFWFVFLTLFFVFVSAFYLAEPGVDCRETCKGIDPTFICGTKINTKNNKAVFEGARVVDNYTLTVDIKCKEDASKSQYSFPEHPYYDVDTQICSGFKYVPDRINCTTNDTLGQNVRRLCYCVDKGEFISCMQIFFIIECRNSFRCKKALLRILGYFYKY